MIKKRTATPKESLQPPILSGLSSINIAKMLSHFMTFRSTIKDLSVSLQRMEKMLDSTYQMFEIAQTMMDHKSNPKQFPAPVRKKQPRQDPDQEEIPIINLPQDDSVPQSPFSQLFRHFDPQLFMQILKSPMAQRLFSQLLAQPKNASARIRKKQG